MNRDEVAAVLRKANPNARADDIAMYADSYMDYAEAQDNIAKNGNVVAHPRTGQPIDNPYIKIKASAMNQLRKITRIKKVGVLWDDPPDKARTTG